MTLTAEQHFEKYLSARGVDLAVARKYGCKPVNGGEINTFSGRTDGVQMVSGILIGDSIRPQRCPVWPKDKDDPDVWQLDIFQIPANERFKSGWRFAARGKFHGWYEDDANVDNYEGEVFEYEGGLVKVRASKDDAREIDILQVPYYPATAPDDERLNVMKFVTKKGAPRQLYVPEPVVGNRPLLIVEGFTRVLAVLSHNQGLSMDVVGLPSCSISSEKMEQLVGLAKTANTIYVVLDGDVTTNPRVTAALGRVVKALQIEDEDRDIRIGIPQVWNKTNGTVTTDKVGLDDFLAQKPEELGQFLADCLPWDPVKAVDRLVFIAKACEGANYVSTAWVPGSELMGAQWSLALYETLRQRLIAAGYPTERHPEPEGKLRAPDAEDIAAIAETYILPATGHLRVGEEWMKVGANKLCTPVSATDFDGVVDRRLAALMGSEPTQRQHGEAMHKVTVRAEAADVVAVRRSGENVMAFAELPAAVPGPMPAWEQFLSRLSDRDCFLAWIHTLTIEGFRGRQAMYLKGDGHDGKTTVIGVLAEALGPCATTIDHITSKDNRFALAGVKTRTRLVYFDDVRNPNLLGPKNVRQLIGGGMIETTAKYKDAQVIEARPRVVIASNIQLKYGDRSETTRILQVDVAERVGPGDAGWPGQLAAELPHLLASAAEAFGRLVDGTTIVPSAATMKVMEQGTEEIEAEFARLLDQLIFDASAEIDASILQGLADSVGIRDWKYQDFCRYLKTRGAESGKRRDHGRRRVWIGVGLKRVGVTGRGDRVGDGGAVTLQGRELSRVGHGMTGVTALS